MTSIKAQLAKEKAAANNLRIVLYNILLKSAEESKDSIRALKPLFDEHDCGDLLQDFASIFPTGYHCREAHPDAVSSFFKRRHKAGASTDRGTLIRSRSKNSRLFRILQNNNINNTAVQTTMVKYN